jgi:metallo-beta-lactamase family protein
MNITFLGAAQTVTGSCTLIETEEINLLIDCGLFQGSKEIREFNYADFLFNPEKIHYVLLTHAHIDHSGLLPKLYKHGFRGKVISTSGTIELCEILLLDSAYIQESEVKRKNKKLLKAGKKLLEPIYSIKDAESILTKFEKIEYNNPVYLNDNVKIIFRNAGHILGSSFIEVYFIDEDTESKTKLIFSGDIGHENLPIINKPDTPLTADLLVFESTYGNRIHENVDDKQRMEDLKNVVLDTIAKKGKLIIPAFAVERTQDLLFSLNKLFAAKQIPEIPVFIDSPLSIKATRIFSKNPQYFNDDVNEYILEDATPFSLPNYTFTETVEESMSLNDTPGPLIIIASSGMCDAGRIKHHLKHNLWLETTTVLFVGYQAMGTPGRHLLEGNKTIRIHGETISVKANIKSIMGFSAHADRPSLISWLTNFIKFPNNIFLVHGELDQMTSLQEAIETNFCKNNTILPQLGDVYHLSKQRKLSYKKNILEKNKFNEKKECMDIYSSIKRKIKELISKKTAQNELESLINELKKMSDSIDNIIKE